MIAISAAWLDPARERPLFEDHALLAPLLPRLQEVHGQLVSFEQRKAAAPIQANIRDLTTALVELDATHDRLARGIYGLLTSLAELSEDTSSRAVLLDVRDDLLPAGLREVQRTYLEQSGNLRRVREHVLTARRDVLRTIPLPAGDTLADAVEAWADTGLQFESLDARRRELQRDRDEVVPAIPHVEVRHAWGRLANAVIAAADLEGLPRAALARLLGPLQDAEGKADRAATRRRSTPEEEYEEPALEEESSLVPEPVEPVLPSDALELV